MEKSVEVKLKELKKTIDFKWRVQRLIPNKNNPTHAVMIPYVDARDVQDRLDTVIGAAGWQNKYVSLDGRLMCGIGILLNGEWIWKWDRGVETQTEKEKGEASDAFKRAAVLWGINRDAYHVGTVKVKVKPYMDKFFPCTDDGARFLKGNELYTICNMQAKVQDMDNYNIEIGNDFLSEYKHEKALG